MTDALLNFLERQKRAVLSRIGAGKSPRETILVTRWEKELVADTACTPQTATDFLVTLSDQVTKAVGPLSKPRDRVAAARTVFAYFAEAFDGNLDPTPQAVGNHMVYKLIDARSRFLYIGITDRGPVRLAEHYRHKPWFGEVMKVEFERFATRKESEAREKFLIKRHAPLHNIQHNEGRQVA